MFLTQALVNLRPGAKWNCSSNDGKTLTKLEWLSPEFSVPTQEEIDTEMARLQAEYDAREYQRVRAPQYPSIADQLDMLWHAMDNGALPKVDSFYDAIKAVKDANPKP